MKKKYWCAKNERRGAFDMITMKGSSPRKSMDIDGELWVSDFKRDVIHCFDNNMKFVKCLEHPSLKKPRGMCVFKDSLLVSCFDGNGWITKINPAGCGIWKICQRPRGIVYDGQFVYVTEVCKGVISKISEDSTTVCEFGTGLLSMPRGIDVNGHSLVVADSGNDRVVGLSSETGSILWALPAHAPNDVIISEDECYVSQWYLKSVKRLSDGHEWTPHRSGYFTMIGKKGCNFIVGDDSGAIHLFSRSEMKPPQQKTVNELDLQILRPSLLDLSGQEVDDLSFQRFVPQIKRCGDIHRIELWQNQLSDYSVINLMNIVQTDLRSLTTLCLGRNRMGNEGLLAIGMTLVKTPTLTDVYVDDNFITSDGVANLRMLISSAPQLRRLGLDTNQIDDSEALSLVDLLSSDTFSRFEFVSLKNNPVSEVTRICVRNKPFVVI